MPGRGVGGASTLARRTPLGKPFYLLFAASLAASVTGCVHTLGRSLSMDGLGFAAAAIAGAGAVGGAVTLPLPLLLGRLSDRMGRERLLVLSYLASAASMSLLALSSSLWQFWLAALAGGISSSLGQALTTDLVPPESLARGLSLYGITVRLGSVIGFAGTGHAVARLGLASTMVASVLLPLVAIALIAAVRQARMAESPDVGRA